MQRTISVNNMTFTRSIRSTTNPANGNARILGSMYIAIVIPITTVEPVNEYTTTGKITIVIELPKVESNCPIHKNLKCGDALTGNSNLPI